MSAGCVKYFLGFFLQKCDFRKTRSNTARRVTYQGDMKLISGSHVCRRWFITINGKECTSPDTIDAVLFFNGGASRMNHHRPVTLDGFCENIPEGRIIVGPVYLWENVEVATKAIQVKRTHAGTQFVV